MQPVIKKTNIKKELYRRCLLYDEVLVKEEDDVVNRWMKLERRKTEVEACLKGNQIESNREAREGGSTVQFEKQ